MSPIWPGAAVLVSAILALLRILRPAAAEKEPVHRDNYAGVSIPVTLGRALVLSAQVATLLVLALASLAGPVPEWHLPLIVVGGCLLLYAAGSMDDRRAHGPRGLRGHIESLLRGKPTTGIVKLLLGAIVSVVVAMDIGGGIGRVLVATVMIALSVNVTNALDVRPGRALKWGLLVLVPAGAAAWGEGIALVVLAYAGAAAVILWFDLRERGMLGDAGSNPLGLVTGAALAAVLPWAGLIVALVFLAGLQVAAETVTITRLIEATPPARWLDSFGRRT